MNNPQHHQQSGSQLLRRFRKLHRQTALLLFVFFIVMAVSGLLLGWKKNNAAPLLPPTQTGRTTDVKNWLSFDSLQQIAIQTLHARVSPAMSAEIDRIDARPQKGTVKFLFAVDYWEVQLDGSTGSVLSVERRYSDLVERIHDGSLFDQWLGTGGEQGKLTYTTIMGLALLLLTITGCWLWYGPKRIRSRRRHRALH